MPGALAHAVDRPVDPGRPRPHGRDGRAGREPEVVVAVEVHRHVRARPTRPSCRRGRRPPRARRCRACRPPRPRAHPPRRPTCRRARRTPGSARVESTPKNAAWMPCSAAKLIAAVIRPSIFSRSTPIASSFRSEIGDSITEAGTPSSTSASRSAGTAREKPHTWARSPAAAISFTASQSSCETRGKPASIRSIPSSSSSRAISSFCSGSSTTPTVCSPSRSVVSYSPTVPAHPVRVVQRRRSRSAQPHCTTPSGNGESFSAPSLPIRKLSSTRNPPPPSQ